MPSYGLVSTGLQWYHKWYTPLHVADGQSKEMTRDSYFNKRQITIILIVIIRVVIITRFCHENSNREEEEEESNLKHIKALAIAEPW